MKFTSAIQERGEFQATFADEVVKNETMFFNCDLQFAYEHGGPLTKAFIDGLPEDWKNCNPVLDSRVHMLMPGWLTCIGGFHHDDIPRNTPNGQPNYQSPDYLSEHLMGLVNADISPTLFALGEHELPLVTDDIVYKVWHPLVEQQMTEGILKPYEVSSGKYVQFDWQSMHMGVPVRKNGWRWFVRLSRCTDRQKKITNEIRKQTQVYLDPKAGW